MVEDTISITFGTVDICLLSMLLIALFSTFALFAYHLMSYIVGLCFRGFDIVE